jgi:hypothetical protein
MQANMGSNPGPLFRVVLTCFCAFLFLHRVYLDGNANSLPTDQLGNDMSMIKRPIRSVGLLYHKIIIQ